MKNTKQRRLSLSNILTFDVGGTNIKATVLSESGDMIQDFRKVSTPKIATPENVLDAMSGLAAHFNDYEKISVGFPGFVKKGIVHTAPNLGTAAWHEVNLNKLLRTMLNKPVRIVNDADLQGLAIVRV